uniref:Biogenesis of lysosome-related organelles complex 1 subunit 3 n=1 Tax=Anopheles atroparvus TaxID=41427 RepID=A0AAG5CZB5_ANOAO
MKCVFVNKIGSKTVPIFVLGGRSRQLIETFVGVFVRVIQRTVMETRSPNIVAGEASETDDDEAEVISVEKGITHISPNYPGNGPPMSPPFTFAREAVESSSVAAASDEELQRLHTRRAMNERCISMLNEFIHSTVISVSKQLNETDNFLMKSQMVLQNTTVSVKKTNDNTHQMKSKLQGMLTSNFVPNINL